MWVCTFLRSVVAGALPHAAVPASAASVASTALHAGPACLCSPPALPASRLSSLHVATANNQITGCTNEDDMVAANHIPHCLGAFAESDVVMVIASVHHGSTCHGLASSGHVGVFAEDNSHFRLLWQHGLWMLQLGEAPVQCCVHTSGKVGDL